MARILIVDDDPLIRHLVRDTLEARGHYVAPLDRSRHVVAAIRAHEPDALILDLMMPDQDGQEVLTRLRAHGLTLPTVLMSAYLSEATGPDWIARTEGLEPILFLAKPFSIDALLAAVDRALALEVC